MIIVYICLNNSQINSNETKNKIPGRETLDQNIQKNAIISLLMDSKDVMDIYTRLSEHFGDQMWWPADTPFEVMIGAILTQQTAWRNVEISIKNLKNAGLLEIEPLVKAPIEKVENCVRPSGFFRQKAKRIKSLAHHLWEDYEGDLDSFFGKDVETLRSELLNLEGIGPETADSILLYADSKLKFVVDAYTFRTFKRLGKDFKGSYKMAQDFFEEKLPEDLKLYRNYHALIVELGKNFCRTKPLCSNCPLNSRCEYNINK
jgi:endonuclease-3 related protein